MLHITRNRSQDPASQIRARVIACGTDDVERLRDIPRESQLNDLGGHRSGALCVDLGRVSDGLHVRQEPTDRLDTRVVRLAALDLVDRGPRHAGERSEALDLSQSQGGECLPNLQGGGYGDVHAG